jgi:hypothetical protein
MAAFLGNPVLTALVIPVLATLTAAGWKVLAKPSPPTREDWLIGWDLMLAAAVLVLAAAAANFAYLDRNPGDAPTIWVLWLRLWQFVVIFAALFIIAIVVKSNYSYVPYHGLEPNGRAMRWCNVGGMIVITINYLVIAYSFPLYDVWIDLQNFWVRRFG